MKNDVQIKGSIKKHFTRHLCDTEIQKLKKKVNFNTLQQLNYLTSFNMDRK